MKKKYKKILSFILTLLLLILIFNPGSSKNTTNTIDQTDQEQTQTSGKDYIYNAHYKAQSFKPTSKVLTRIQLYINKIGSINSDFEIMIKDSLTGENITNYSVSSSEIPNINPEWIEFNFADITLTINKTYYIICKTNLGDQSNAYNWYEASDNPYERGTKYFSDDDGVTWQQSSDYDFCFKTYTQKAELEIQYIKGGFGWNINYGIKNIGNIETNNITVEISLSGGLILKGKTDTININQSINPDEIYDGIFSPVIGIGHTTVTITASSADTITISRKAEAYLFLITIYINPILD